jgi:DNA-binding phage protein
MPLETAPFDEADYLTDPERIAGYLNVVFSSGDLAVIEPGLAVVARAIERYQARRGAIASMVTEAQRLKLP